MIPLHEFLDAAHGAADTPVCRDGLATIGARAFQARALGIAAQMRAHPGQRIALCSDDPYTFACALFGLLACGKEPVIPAHSTPGYLAGLAGAYDAVLTDTELGKLSERNALDVDAARPVSADTACSIDPDAPLTLYTSGSSGTPKPIRKTLGQFNAEVQTLEAQWGALVGNATVLASVPHHHIYGMLFRLFWPLASGRAMDRATCTDLNQLQARITRCGATVVVSTPAQLSRWPDLPGFAALEPRPRAFFSSGGPLALESAQRFAATLGSAPLEIFGSTETGGIAWRRQSESDAWQPLPGVEVRRAEDGALAVRSPHLGHDAWHRTDDEAAFDADGRFRLRGRLDRVVKLDGKRVSLAEIENHLLLHPFVAQAATARIDGASRERIGALVVLSGAGKEALRREGRVQLVKTLRRHLAVHCEAAALPRHWRFREALPFDARGKLQAAEVARAFDVREEGFEMLVEACDQNECFYDLRVPRTLVHFAGHFPGLPILPGVVQIDWAVRLASERVPAVRAPASIDQLRFMAPVPGGAVLRLVLTHDATRRRVQFVYRLGERDCASGFIVYREPA
jgi:acyl-CoA synthetase (AMP-forming)/AMP-acid ligase II/3-hydroxymyristoyl/3-hydroxydecanoyl-(acyl carrier protein) dehydratase